MGESLIWEKTGQTLILKGTLDRNSLLPLWQQKEKLLVEINDINVSQLEYVDSTGLALLVRFKHHMQMRGDKLRFSGIDERLNTLITLYDLQEIIIDS
ncbi:lipid asymmetry maintenance protein MlaB [Photorhabdus laumondii subsp. laumondii]|uniref:Photorhabdus luminescens subsp. laumondii TTO1 complete genome segment 14/17 n=2 Tax=Photorhabdus laumondii subsp. laumondii TaxID=141679 RepID=Q7N066_PHOLL|nr:MULTISPECIES: lipid asymmetry maintenance protein MlaB [Photorhabdus]AWK43617.1 anti-sigma B factor antagonist [Photorhabdus laumondii subsp. laumondii]AXG44300.1 STAS domain-containing protein [Photorhabdus laumondii subsp. laumondii]AXG48929.1 STAS domain-containing protein [Photorhabdus laumondii subsp. laumondii]MCC8385375.1 lipid asymmetry maintenance protein MlaB [Photorhabdus laumondii]MCC8389652.1 lipid asymmetry maintenance protein MlaB [Photorhabdus laumondii]